MKRSLFLSVLSGLLLASLLLGSCRQKVVMPEFSVVLTDTVVTHHGVPCKFQYAFTSISNAAKSPALQAIEEANIAYCFSLEGFRGNAREAIALSIDQFMSYYVDGLDETARDAVPEMDLIVESDARVVDSLLVYTISSSSYTGGAHGIYSLNCHNYSIAGGYELTLSDLFDAAQQQALQTLIRHKLYEQFNVSGDEGLVDQGFFPEQIAATENFEVTPDGIIFYYNPYDIGSYALGEVKVHATSQELEAL